MYKEAHRSQANTQGWCKSWIWWINSDTWATRWQKSIQESHQFLTIKGFPLRDKNEKRIDFIIFNFPIFSAFYLRNKGEYGSLPSLKSEWSCMTGWGFWNVGESDHWYAQTDLRAGIGYPPISFSFDGGLKKMTINSLRLLPSRTGMCFLPFSIWAGFDTWPLVLTWNKADMDSRPG